MVMVESTLPPWMRAISHVTSFARDGAEVTDDYGARLDLFRLDRWGDRQVGHAWPRSRRHHRDHGTRNRGCTVWRIHRPRARMVRTERQRRLSHVASRGGAAVEFVQAVREAAGLIPEGHAERLRSQNEIEIPWDRFRFA